MRGTRPPYRPCWALVAISESRSIRKFFCRRFHLSHGGIERSQLTGGCPRGFSHIELFIIPNEMGGRAAFLPVIPGEARNTLGIRDIVKWNSGFGWRDS